MQFLLFDVSSTLVFLLGYLAAVALLRRRALALTAATAPAPRGARLPAAPRERRKPNEAPQERPAAQCCREWPRPSAPR